MRYINMYHIIEWFRNPWVAEHNRTFQTVPYNCKVEEKLKHPPDKFITQIATNDAVNWGSPVRQSVSIIVKLLGEAE